MYTVAFIRGAKFLKVPLTKGDLGGSDPTGKSFQITSYLNSKFKGVNDNLSIGNWGNLRPAQNRSIKLTQNYQSLDTSGQR
ncbi:hypothetical protein AA650_14010 [Anabaena sp. WA102]|nr:hypothetical protein AA650_14010 [Anabaena sp. WA102]